MIESLSDFKSDLEMHANDIAFILGNGINRFSKNGKASPIDFSWDKLLVDLWNQYHQESHVGEVPKGLSQTEFFDILREPSDRNSKENDLIRQLQLAIRHRMSQWIPNTNHWKVCSFLQNKQIPLLTTNFDNCLHSMGCSLHRFHKPLGFTSYYPWDSYYAIESLSNPLSDFAVWHINGMINYSRSISLGLSQYMNEVVRARKLIHGDKEEEDLFYGKRRMDWKGCNTWLHIILINLL
jgi:hypothetical protein